MGHAVRVAGGTTCAIRGWCVLLLAGMVPLLAQSFSEVGLEKIGDAEEQAGHETNPKLRPFC